MAKIESAKSLSNFYSSKSPFPDFGLGIATDCSTKCDFDICSLLSDNETFPEKQYNDDNKSNGANADKNSSYASLTSLSNENLKFSPPNAFAENHLKNNRMLPELKFDGDFNLSDLLSNDECPKSHSNNISFCESVNLFDLCLLTEDDNPNVEKISSTKNDVSFDDLSLWINSSVPSVVDSLDRFISDDIKSKHENKLPFSYEIKEKDSDNGLCDYLENIERKPHSSNSISNIDLLDILGEVKIHDSDTIDNTDETDSSKRNSQESESINEISDDSDCFPDVDLTFCIKKNAKKEISSYGGSPETIDSGFDESDFVAEKPFAPFTAKSFYKNCLISQSGTYNKNIKNYKIKQSLFSKAISAKPKIDDTKKSKLRNVINKLCEGSPIPSFSSTQNTNLKDSQKAIDRSFDHVVVSSFLTFTNEK